MGHLEVFAKVLGPGVAPLYFSMLLEGTDDSVIRSLLLPYGLNLFGHWHSWSCLLID